MKILKLRLPWRSRVHLPLVSWIPSAGGPLVRRGQDSIIACAQIATSNHIPGGSGGAKARNHQHRPFGGCTEPNALTYFVRSMRIQTSIGAYHRKLPKSRLVKSTFPGKCLLFPWDATCGVLSSISASAAMNNRSQKASFLKATAQGVSPFCSLVKDSRDQISSFPVGRIAIRLRVRH